MNYYFNCNKIIWCLSKEQDPKNPVFHLWGKKSVSTAIKHPKERTKRFWVLGWALNKERKWINLNWPCNLSTLNCRKKIFKANLVVEFLFDRKERLAKKDNSFFFYGRLKDRKFTRQGQMKYLKSTIYKTLKYEANILYDFA